MLISWFVCGCVCLSGLKLTHNSWTFCLIVTKFLPHLDPDLVRNTFILRVNGQWSWSRGHTKSNRKSRCLTPVLNYMKLKRKIHNVGQLIMNIWHHQLRQDLKMAAVLKISKYQLYHLLYQIWKYHCKFHRQIFSMCILSFLLSQRKHFVTLVRLWILPFIFLFRGGLLQEQSWRPISRRQVRRVS